MAIRKSEEWLQRALRVIPGASQTFSKAPAQYVRGVSPMFLARGQGSHVWDVDGNEYIDYPTSLGPIILGYADPDVNDAIVCSCGRDHIRCRIRSKPNWRRSSSRRFLAPKWCGSGRTAPMRLRAP